VALNGADECCGFGGLFAVKNAAISTAMGQRKTQNIAKQRRRRGCAVRRELHDAHQRPAQRARDSAARAVHIAQVLANEVDVAARGGASKAEAAKTSPAAPLAGWESQMRTRRLSFVSGAYSAVTPDV
jgi:hypothetical protein